jgi:hypothetical protein
MTVSIDLSLVQIEKLLSHYSQEAYCLKYEDWEEPFKQLLVSKISVKFPVGCQVILKPRIYTAVDDTVVIHTVLKNNDPDHVGHLLVQKKGTYNVCWVDYADFYLIDGLH